MVPLRHGAPGAAVVVQDGASIPHGEDIGGRAAPDTIKVIRGAAAHGAPGAAVIVQDGAAIPHGEDIGGRAAPDTIKAVRGAAAHGAPGAAIVVQDGATITHGEDIGGGTAPDTIEVASWCRCSWCSRRCHRSAGWCPSYPRRRHRWRSCPRHHKGHCVVPLLMALQALPS